jgi:hypothetical protein
MRGGDDAVSERLARVEKKNRQALAAAAAANCFCLP